MSGLKFDELSIFHFRSYQQFRQSFDGRPVAFFGRNGAGKTNLLEALSLFAAGRGLRRAPLDSFANQQANLGWKLALKGHDGSDIFEMETFARPNEPRQVIIDGKSATQMKLGDRFRVLWLVPSQDRLWMDSASERRKFYDRIVMSFYPQHGEAVLNYEKAMRNRNRLFKEQIHDPYWLDSLEKQMAEASEHIIRHRAHVLQILNQTSKTQDSAFPVVEMDLQYDAAFGEAFDYIDFFQKARERDRFAGTTRNGPHKMELEAVFTAKNQAARLCSTGEQKALLVSLNLANARALLKEQNQPPVLLLDEVAAHLDPARRAALYDEVIALDCPVFMTGTEASLFEELGTRGQQFHVAEDDDGFSHIVER